MKTVLEVLTLSAEFLRQRSISNPRRQAEELLSEVLGIPRVQLYMEFDQPLSELEIEKCRTFLMRRGKKEPLQYIIGKVEFYHCTFVVNQAVLIPRQETEILVDKIVTELSKYDLDGKVLVDVCCGSGCIGIALKKKFPTLKVVLSDVSEEALAIAQQNARINEVDVEILQGDLVEPFIERKTNFLVCNPPYITEDEFRKLEAEVQNYEPRIALVSGKTGLEFYERLAFDLPNVLLSRGKAWFELGRGQGEDVRHLFARAPWTTSRVEQDWAGHDRFFFLEIE